MIRHKKLSYALLGIVFVLFALIQAPMSLVLGLLPSNLRIDGCEGTLWHGRAAAFGVDGQIVQQALRWNFSPRHLWQGQLAWSIQGSFQQHPSQLNLLLGPTQIAVQNIKLALPAGPLLGLHDRLKPLKLGGLLTLNSPHLALNQTATLNGRLENLFSPLAPTQGPLGSYRLALSLQPDQSGQWQVSPEQGLLSIRGTGTLNLAHGSASGALAFQPQGTALDSLKPVLASLPRQNNAYTLQFSAH